MAKRTERTRRSWRRWLASKLWPPLRDHDRLARKALAARIAADPDLALRFSELLDEHAGRVERRVAEFAGDVANRSRRDRRFGVGTFAIGVAVTVGAALLFRPALIDGADRPRAVGPIDVERLCDERFGEGAVAQQSEDPTVWQCVVGRAVHLLSISDLEEACLIEYGRAARVTRADDGVAWQCDYGFVFDDDGECTIVPGEVSPSFDMAASLTHALQEAYDALDGEELWCPLTPVLLTRGGAALQELTRGKGTATDVSALTAAPTAPAVAVPPEPWRAYRALRTIALRFLGVPINQPHETEVGWVVDTSEGGVLVARSEHGAYFAMPGFAFDAWVDSGAGEGCLGFPIGDGAWNGGDTLSQDFEHGTMKLSIVGDGLRLIPDDGPECGHVPAADLIPLLTG